MAEPAVLDSSAVLAVIFDEPGADAVVDRLNQGLLSTVNLTETHTRMLLAGWPVDTAWNRLHSMGFQICPYSEDEARTAAELVLTTRHLGLSLGDRACLALAMERKAPVYTTDRAWSSLKLGIAIHVIR